MAYTINERKYYWYVEGKYIYLYEMNDDGYLVKPTKEIKVAITGTDPVVYDGLQLEVTRVPDFSTITDESKTLPIPESLENALVDYVKSELADDPKMREYFMMKFRDQVSRFGATRAGGARIVKSNWVMRS